MDNGGAVGQATVLPAIGGGTVQSLGGPGAFYANLPHNRGGGEWIAILASSGALRGLYRYSYAEDTTKVTLSPNGPDVPSVAIGDLWRGVYRFDSAVVAGGATLVSNDPILGYSEQLPAVTASYPGTTPLRPGDSFSIAFVASDDTGLARVSLDLSGAMTYHEEKLLGGVRASSGSFASLQVPAGATGTIDVLVTATDVFNQTKTDHISLVLGAADSPPFVSDLIYSGPVPPRPGDVFSVVYDVRDDIGLSRVDLAISDAVTLTGSQTASGIRAQGTFGPFTVPASAAGTMTITVTAVDQSGQTGSSSLPIALGAADEPPTVTGTYGGPMPLRPGDSFPVSFTARDDVGLARVRIDLSGAVSGSDERTVSGIQASGVFGPFAVPSGATGTVHVLVTAFDTGGRPGTWTLDVTLAGTDAPPAIFGACSCGNGLRPGDSFSVSFHATDDVGLASVAFDASVAVIAHDERTLAGELTADGTFGPVAVPADATGTVHVLLTARDSGGHAQTFTLDLPVVGLAVTATAASPVEAGSGLVVSAHATSPAGVRSMTVSVSGAFTYQRLVNLASAGGGAPVDVTRQVVIPVPGTAWNGTASVRVTVTDTANATVASAPVDVTFADTQAPAIEVISPRDGEMAGIGQGIDLSFEVHDAGVIELLRIEAGTGSWEQGSPSGTTLGAYDILPDTTPTGPLQVRFIARDAAGNERTVTRSITVLPAQSPRGAFVCGGPGTMTIAGADVPLALDASMGETPVRVEFYRKGDSTPFAVRNANENYSASYQVPPDTPDGSVVPIVARILTAAGKSTDIETEIVVVSGDVLTGDVTLGPDDRSHEDHTVVVSQGWVVMSGPHRFARLAVLPGGAITHPRGERVDLTVTGEASISCNGVFAASGLGYRGGSNGWESATGETFPGLTGSGPGIGGSHAGAGAGGAGSTAGATFGSVIHPDTPGAGGGASTDNLNPGGNGGGVLVFSAAALRNEGLFLAEGENSNTGGSGAGGSIAIEAAAVAGRGWFQAGGGLPDTTEMSGRSGGGGRIAIRGRVSPETPVFAGPASQAWATSGPGTVFYRHADDVVGHLVVDGSPSASPGETRLVSIGAGSVSAVTDTAITDTTAAWVHGVEGLEIEVTRGTSFVGRFRVVSLSSSTTLVLDPSAVDQIQAGDRYQGIQKFDTIVLHSQARVVTTDVLEGALQVDPGSAISGPTPRGVRVPARDGALRKPPSWPAPPDHRRLPHHGAQP